MANKTTKTTKSTNKCVSTKVDTKKVVKNNQSTNTKETKNNNATSEYVATLSKYAQKMVNSIGLSLDKDQIEGIKKDSATKFYEFKKDCSERLSLDYKVVLKIFYYCFNLKNDKERKEYLSYKINKANKTTKGKKQLQKEALCVAYYLKNKIGQYIGR